MSGEVCRAAGNRFLRVLLEEGRQKADEFEGGVALPDATRSTARVMFSSAKSGVLNTTKLKENTGHVVHITKVEISKIS